MNCRSEYLVRGILCMQGPHDYAFDLCDNGQCPHVYGKQVKMKQRLLRPGERCPICGNHRYHMRNRQIHPVRRHVPACAVSLNR